MLRALAVVALTASLAAAGQPASVLHITVTWRSPGGDSVPVARHALLISDNPATAAPRRVLTSADGTVEVRLAPGSYVVESDQPARLHGQSVTWTEVVVIADGTNRTLALTADNATAVTEPAVSPDASASSAGPPAHPLLQWRDSVVAIWTPASRASGFIVDARGLIATEYRAVAPERVAEVQLSPARKVAARVVEADAARGVAVLQVDPAVVAGIQPVPLACSRAPQPLADAQPIFTVDAPLYEEKSVTPGVIEGGGRHPLADLKLRFGSAGAPVFDAAGTVVGLSTTPDERDSAALGDARIALVDDVCRVIAAAEKGLPAASPPSRTALPVEPLRPFPQTALDQAAARPVTASAYQMSSADFDVVFITPPTAYAARQQADGPGRTGRGGIGGMEAALRARLLTDFGRWADYVEPFPSVLMVRVTPRLAEGFWTTVARGAAWTQGIALPPIKQFKPGFARMQVFCGNDEVTPIHPFTLEWRVSESDAVREGLYVFDAGALSPSCGTVRLVLFSEKTPERGDARIVDAKLVQQIWQDFAPFRETP